MTTAIAPTAPAAPAPAPASRRTAATRLSFSGVVRSEWIKALSLRSIRWTIAVSVVLGLGMSTIMSFAMKDFLPEAVQNIHGEYIAAVTSFPAGFLVLVFAVLGVFMFSSEYSSGMILSTLAAAPRRGTVFAAKGAVLTLISGVVATLIVVGGALISVMVFPEAASALGSTQVLSSMAGTVAYLVAMTLVAFAVAGILRATGGAITAVVALVFLIPLVLQVLSSVTDWTWVMWINEYLPTALGSTLGYGLGSEVPYTLAADAGVHVPNYWESLAALAMWVVWPMFISVKLFFSRDAK